KPYKLDNYTVMGKTGTAQIPNPDGPGYLQGNNNNIYSFLGMATKEDPKLLMHVSVTQTKLKDGESVTALTSFIFRNVIKNSLCYLNIEQDKEEIVESID